MSHRPPFRRWNRIVRLALFAAILACQLPGRAESGPQPPCGGDTFPPYPEPDKPPTVKIWDHSDWTPPACTTWTASGPATLVATVGRFRHTSGVEGLRARIGAVSELRGLLYWSTTSQRWQTLIVDAYALSGPAGDRRRKDFSLEEIVEGRSLYVQQEDNLFGKAAYRTTIVSASAGRLVFSTENASPIRYLAIRIFSVFRGDHEGSQEEPSWRSFAR